MIPTALAACPIPNSDPATTGSDGDGYTDADEIANGTDPCSAASVPPDFNHNFISDLNDPDDDSDGILDVDDQLFFDAQNGAATPVPLSLEWAPSSPALGLVASSGFTGIQISSNAATEPASGHALIRGFIHAGDAGGHLTLQTSGGTAEGPVNTQVNALQLGFDSSSAFRIWSRIVQPFAGTTPAVGHVGAIFFGPNEDNYARLGIIGTATGAPAVQFAVEQGGTFVEQGRIAFGGAIDNFDLYLVGTASMHTITAYWDLNTTGALHQLGSPIVVPAWWFSTNAGAAANMSLAGLMVSHGSAAPMAFGYEFFRIDRNAAPAGPPPPDPPSNPSPANGATGVPTNTGLSWSSPPAYSYSVSFGTTNPPPAMATTQTSSYQPPTPLAAGTMYYWRVAVWSESGTTSGPIWSFTTAGAPPPPSPTDIVIYASDLPASALHGLWTSASDSTSPNGVTLATADTGFSTVNAPIASPTDYVDATFTAPAGTPYALWLRLKATANSKYNDSVWVQLSDASANGSNVYPMNSTSGLLVNLANDSTGSSLNGWGWVNSAYWLSQATTVTFAAGGTHTIRIQVREDGVLLDQIVLSPTTYSRAAPGPISNDHTIVAKP
jgi:hypothetical protein